MKMAVHIVIKQYILENCESNISVQYVQNCEKYEV